jgi:predicted Zn finger-like uncharacterized protein
MKVVCPACNARYRLPDDRVRGKVLKIRCKSCGNIFQVRDPNTQSADSEDIRDRSTRASGTFGAVGSASSGGKQVETSSGSFSDEQIWYYSINGESYGPYRESELHSRFEEGQLGSEAYVWSEGFEQWKLASEVETFASAMETADSNKQESDSEESRAGGKTVSLDSSELSEQLQDESEDAQAKQASDSASKDEAQEKPPEEKDDDGDIRNALASDSFGDAVESALDDMFGGGEPTSDKDEEAETSAADETQEEEDKDDDSLDELRSFLNKSRAKRKQERKKKKAPTKAPPGAPGSDAVELPDEDQEADEIETHEAAESKKAATPSAPDAEEVEVDAGGPEETEPSIEPDEVPATTISQSDEQPDEESAGKPAAQKPAEEDTGDRDDDDSIDISDLLSQDLEGTGFGEQTAAHAAVDDGADEATERKSNKPLILIIIILLLAIAFVTAELLSDDETPEPQPQQPEQSSSANEQPTEELPPSPQELRDRRLAFESAQSTINDAVRMAAQEAFAAVPDSIKNPQQQQQARRQVNRTYRQQRPQREDNSAGSTPPGLGSPSAGFAQPSLGRGDDGGGPSRQIFAQGLNSFVQQSVFQCQQVHQRREGELAVSRVPVSVRVVSSGSVTDVSVPPQISATTFANCLRSQSRNWKFPAFSGDSVVLERTFIIQ